MINCGAICNVVDLLSHLSPEAYIYIIDSNRPVHLANVYPKKDRYVASAPTFDPRNNIFSTKILLYPFSAVPLGQCPVGFLCFKN